MFNKFLNIAILGSVVFLVIKAESLFEFFKFKPGEGSRTRTPDSNENLFNKIINDVKFGFQKLTGGLGFTAAPADVSGVEGRIIIPYGNEIVSNANQLGIEPELIAAIIQQESDGNPRAVGLKNDLGLMQVRPEANKDVNLAFNTSFAWVQNKVPSIAVKQGARYLSLKFKEWRNYDSTVRVCVSGRSGPVTPRPLNYEEVLMRTLQSYNGGTCGVMKNPTKSLGYARQVLRKYESIKSGNFF